jgi:transcription initiation factor IIF auxiliary subunit
MVKLNNVAEPVDEKVAPPTSIGRYSSTSRKPSSTKSKRYVLYPTFPNPERTVRNCDERFALETSGWGEFTIAANVKFRDGHTETATHRLDLGRRPHSL